MKNKILLTTTLFIIGFTSFAQNCLRDSSHVFNAQNNVYQKYYYTYDANDLNSETIRVDSANGVWVNVNKTNNVWYAPGKISEQIEQTWSANQWVNVTRRATTYNVDGNVLVSTTESWDNVNLVWQLSSFQQYYTYNIAGQKTNYLQVYWIGGVVTDSTKHTYTYDGSGNQINTLREGWTTTEPIWRPYQQWNVTYNANDLPDSTANLLYDVNTSSYNLLSSWRDSYDVSNNHIEQVTRNSNNILSSKYNYEYDANNNRLSNSYSMWDGSAWKATNQTNFTYNSNNQQLSYNNMTFNSSLNMLVNNTQYLYTYDADYNNIEVTGYTWDLNTNQWVYNNKTQNFYNCVLSVDDLNNVSKLLIFPNPTSGLLTLKNLNGESITIFNNVGAQLYKVSILSDNQTLDVSHFPNGIYFIQTENGTTQKFIKQ